MSKRFTDTDKYKKPFIRGLKGPYKLLWDYLYHDCNHAGIWIVDFEVAQIYLGADMPVNRDDALRYFNEGENRIVEFDGGRKWLVLPFIKFQYGELNENNRVHHSVIIALKDAGLSSIIKGLTSPLQGCKDKDKDKDKEKVKEKDRVILEKFEEFWEGVPNKIGRGKAREAFAKAINNGTDPQTIINGLPTYVYYENRRKSSQDDYRPLHPTTWLNGERWEDEIPGIKKPTNKKGYDITVRFSDGSPPEMYHMKDDQQLQETIERMGLHEIDKARREYEIDVEQFNRRKEQA